MPPHLDATEAYRTIIIRRDATEILLAPKEAGMTLPRVEIQKKQRIANQLTAAARLAVGVNSTPDHICSLRSFRTLDNFEFDHVLFVQALVSRAYDC